MVKTYINWDDFHKHCDIVASKLQDRNFNYIVALSRGGVVPARIIDEHLNVKHFLVFGLKLFNGMERSNNVEITQALPNHVDFDRHDKILIVDDISDKGTTLKYAYSHIFKESGGAHLTTACPYYKPHTEYKPHFYAKEYRDDEWLVFPFERE